MHALQVTAMKNTNSTRRKFLTQNLLLGSGAMLWDVVGNTAFAENKAVYLPGKSADSVKIGSLTLEQLRDEYKAALFSRFLPNMDSLVIDKEYGGFMCSVDILTRKLLNTN